MKFKIKRGVKLLTVLHLLTSFSAIGQSNSSGVHYNGRQLKPLYDAAPAVNYVDCFWGEPFFYGGKLFYAAGFAGSLNANIDDISTTYWATRVRLGFGDTLVMRGQFGHNRYSSLQSYGVTDPTSSLRDDQIVPDPGSFNPYLQGASRNTSMNQRWFTIKVVNAPAPPDSLKKPNVLYARPPATDPDQQLVDLRWRSYLVDKQYDDMYDNRGGGRLPFPVNIIRANGIVEPFICDRDPSELTLQQARHFTNSQTSVQYWRNLYQNYPCSTAQPGQFCNDPWTAPAQNPPVFEKFFTVPYSEQGLFVPPGVRAASFPPSGCNQAGAPGIPANFDANYGVVFISDHFGKVVRITGKYPITPRTYLNNRTWDTTKTDMRYWSWTSGNARVNGQIVDGVSDEQVPMLNDSTYSIVVSLPENRPQSATQACGNAWLNWGRQGDGTGRWGITALAYRNVLPNSNFQHALQNVCIAGTEAAVMGDYFPTIEYFADAADFEAQVGCNRGGNGAGSNRLGNTSIGISAAPNPSNGQTTINVPLYDGITLISVYSIEGQTLATYRMPANSNSMKIDLRDFAPGLYNITATQGIKTSSVTMVVEK